MVNRCSVLWCVWDLWVVTAHSHLPFFFLWRKTTPNKQRPAKAYKIAMNWAQVTQKKQQQAQVYVSTVISIFMPYFYVSITILNFSYKVFKSFVIVKTVEKLAVIYSPSLGLLWKTEKTVIGNEQPREDERLKYPPPAHPRVFVTNPKMWQVAWV